MTQCHFMGSRIDLVLSVVSFSVDSGMVWEDSSEWVPTRLLVAEDVCSLTCYAFDIAISTREERGCGSALFNGRLLF